MENWRTPEVVHFMNLENAGCPQPKPEPKGYFRTMLPHLSVHEPFSGMILGTDSSGWIRRNERKNSKILLKHDMMKSMKREWSWDTDECGN